VESDDGKSLDCIRSCHRGWDYNSTRQRRRYHYDATEFSVDRQLRSGMERLAGLYRRQYRQ
jgi:hypothetical protein